jgi:endonuclease/exonuclease/phosphatase family metal-dependent hydrolase
MGRFLRSSLLVLFVFSLISMFYFSGYGKFLPALRNEACNLSLTIASYCTDPLCSAHRMVRCMDLVDVLDPTLKFPGIVLKKGALLWGACLNGFASLLTTQTGVFLRYATNFLMENPFIYMKGKGLEKQLEHEMTILTWNLCCVPGGYSITDGGVLPWHLRIESIAKALKNKDADILCLSEIFDIQTAQYLKHSLEDIYSHFFIHIGPNPIGPSSGLFVASKIGLSDPEFIAFPPDATDGRTRFCRKGVFSFNVGNKLRIYTTHLQHSEIPLYPTEKELIARQKQISLILERMLRTQNKVVILTGDLNLDKDEWDVGPWKNFFEKGELLDNSPTWGGDEWVSQLASKPSSPANTLDHTFLLKNSFKSFLKTTYVETAFDGKRFKPDALSDHKGLFTTLSLDF